MLGLNYYPVKFIRLRPVVRYDWQRGSETVKMFGAANTDGNTARSQRTAALNVVYYF